MVTITWKVYGIEGHRQKHSFAPSYRWNFSEDNKVRIIEVRNCDITGTNNYSIVAITRDTREECINELYGQISDGIFENSQSDLLTISSAVALALLMKS